MQYQSVWDAIEDCPETAARLRVRSDLMIQIRETVRSWKFEPRQAASHLQLTPLRLSELLEGKLDRFDIEDLIAIAFRAGLQVDLTINRSRRSA